MATQADIEYITSTEVTCGLETGPLASDTNLLAGRASAAVDNTSEEAVDYSVYIEVTTGTSPTASRVIEVWVAASEDGTNYAGGNGGSDANKTHTAESKANMVLIASMGTNATSNTAYEFVISSLAGLLGGAIPRKFSFFVVHNTAVALNSTAGNQTISVTPLHYTST